MNAIQKERQKKSWSTYMECLQRADLTNRYKALTSVSVLFYFYSDFDPVCLFVFGFIPVVELLRSAFQRHKGQVIVGISRIKASAAVGYGNSRLIFLRGMLHQHTDRRILHARQQDLLPQFLDHQSHAVFVFWRQVILQTVAVDLRAGADEIIIVADTSFRGSAFS